MSALGATVGADVRFWRTRRRLSQLQLALEAGVSARHLSCVETGRAHPGRETLRRLLECLDVPLREQNRLLLAAGHAPQFAEHDLGATPLAPVRVAVTQILARHEPYPGLAFDRRWDLVAANRAMTEITASVPVAPQLLRAPVNIARIGLHPQGLAPLIVNYAQWRRQVVGRIRRQAAAMHDPGLDLLADELLGYPSPTADDDAHTRTDDGVLGPLHLRTADGRELRFVGMLASFDSPFEVTTSELALELLFPADASTAEHLGAGR